MIHFRSGLAGALQDTRAELATERLARTIAERRAEAADERAAAYLDALRDVLAVVGHKEWRPQEEQLVLMRARAIEAAETGRKGQKP